MGFFLAVFVVFFGGCFGFVLWLFVSEFLSFSLSSFKFSFCFVSICSGDDKVGVIGFS